MVLVDPFGVGVRYVLITGPCSRVEEALNCRRQTRLVVFGVAAELGKYRTLSCACKLVYPTRFGCVQLEYTSF